jgi:hypothetical protein
MSKSTKQVTQAEYLDHCTRASRTFHTQDSSTGVPESRWPLVCNWFDGYNGNTPINPREAGRVVYLEDGSKQWFINEEAQP